MALDDAEYEAMHAQVAQERADAAADWDADSGATDAALDVAADVRGPLVDEAAEIMGSYEISPRVGPLEFRGKEDFIRGGLSRDLVGAAIIMTVPQRGVGLHKQALLQKQPQGFVHARTPAGKPTIAHVVKHGKPLDHKTAIKNARDVAKRALSIAKKLDTAVKKGGAHHVLGAGEFYEIVGDLVGAFHRPGVVAMTPSQLTAMAQKLRDAANKLTKGADTHEKYVKKVNDNAKKSVDKFKKTYGPSGKKGSPVQVLGYIDFNSGDMVDQAAFELMGMDWVDLVGQTVPQPDPNNPGLYTDGTPDTVDAQVPDPNGNMVPNPNYQAGSAGSSSSAGGTLPSSGSTVPSSLAATVPGPPDYGAGKQPTQSGSTITLSDGTVWPDPSDPDYQAGPDPSTDMAIYGSSLNNIPAGAVYYDVNVMGPIPWQGLGSFHRFYAQKDNSDGKANSGFQWGGGDPSIMDGWYWWWHGATSGTEYKHENAGNSLPDGYQGAHDDTTRQKESIKIGWGPLIGNPNGVTQGLRFDQDKGCYFWFWGDAPLQAQMTAPNGLGAAFKKAQLDYQTALTTGKANYAAAVAQDQLNAQAAAKLAQQQALEDSQAQHQLELAQTQAQAQSAAQQPQLDQQQAQLQNQQQQLALQAQQQQQQMQQQMQQLQYQQAQAEEQAYQQFLQSPMPMDQGVPDQGAMDQGVPDQGGASGDYGDTGYGDVSNSPFSDVSDQVPEYADTTAFDQDTE